MQSSRTYPWPQWFPVKLTNAAVSKPKTENHVRILSDSRIKKIWGKINEFYLVLPCFEGLLRLIHLAIPPISQKPSSWNAFSGDQQARIWNWAEKLVENFHSCCSFLLPNRKLLLAALMRFLWVLLLDWNEAFLNDDNWGEEKEWKMGKSQRLRPWW